MRSLRWPTAKAVAWRVNWSGGEPSVWGPLPLPTLDESVSVAITNNDGDGFAQIVGRDGPYQPQTVVAWTVQSLSDGTLAVDPLPRIVVEAGDVRARGVNDGGTICGDGDWPPEALVWTEMNHRLCIATRNITSASAQDINNSGTIVGSARWTSTILQP